MKKLWQKNWELNKEIEIFETKDDLLMDQKLVKYDCFGSLAHAKMLNKIGIFSREELFKIDKGLMEIIKLNDQGKFILQNGDEDVHTKIENYLTKKYGQVGKKIHTGRSRNDQVLTALRLFTKEYLQEIEKALNALIKRFGVCLKKYEGIPMPGYTHMQKAMPSTISLWMESFTQSLEDDLIVLKAVYKLNNQSPLGSGAGYGIPIRLDRQFSAKLLGFEKIQQNPIYCQNSRGKIEALILSALVSILQSVNKFASDVLLFTTAEFNFFATANNLTTGSSIMPQKKNMDIAELLRSKVHLVLGNYIQIVSLSSNLISGYSRDLQDSKKPLMESLEITLDSLKVAKILLENIAPNEQVLRAAMTAELYATEKTLKLVLKGEAFRDAYKKVSSEFLR
ncbi:argininosuccinate lyase [Candidatus Daviesbacteria bacterium]|nr:argininosuccinate lyase [Candidatus Daviesbacteria bacterium]